jgi:hypothetical protein
LTLQDLCRSLSTLRESPKKPVAIIQLPSLNMGMEPSELFRDHPRIKQGFYLVLPGFRPRRDSDALPIRKSHARCARFQITIPVQGRSARPWRTISTFELCECRGPRIGLNDTSYVSPRERIVSLGKYWHDQASERFFDILYDRPESWLAGELIGMEK